MVDTIKELSSLSRKLNQKSDTLNATIESINEKLGKLNFGVEVWVDNRPVKSGDPYCNYDLDRDGRFPKRDVRLLGYCRVGDEWQLAIKDATWQRDDQGDEYTVEAKDPIPLLKASRATRYKAVRLIPQLLEGMKDDVEKILEDIDEAEKAAKAL